ncbi:unnamed protein product [Vitrella brassicaformis CCMP3155]|uniref:Protein kinase domain-containing protein n=1 Tax=Vitrella brassicaformis (strain CCMP3155) TaxID=1169540 RepID=A0A0G4F6N0_VITBC|nr:unnamed protein product [Vitrella brassicaformis CCMP3155]|eukprot:CEM08086.1 unnamed protein product [Vitrella brassicaformis CCMP3155]
MRGGRSVNFVRWLSSYTSSRECKEAGVRLFTPDEEKQRFAPLDDKEPLLEPVDEEHRTTIMLCDDKQEGRVVVCKQVSSAVGTEWTPGEYLFHREEQNSLFDAAQEAPDSISSAGGCFSTTYQAERAVGKALRSTALFVDSSTPAREGLHGWVEVLYDKAAGERLAFKIFKLYETDEGRDENGFIINGWDVAAAIHLRHENIIDAPRILKVRSPHAAVKVAVMPFINGGTLADRRFAEALGEEREHVLMTLLKQAMEGLLHLHSVGLLHTDMLGAEANPGGNMAINVDPPKSAVRW